MSVTIRLVTRADVPTLLDLMRANREFLAPLEPLRAEEYFTCEYQDAAVATALEHYEHGTVAPYVILDVGDIVARITLNNIVRGPLQSTKVGSWVAAAATLLHNVRSQRVLERHGFVRFGVAPRYLQIAGEYQDHALYQLLAEG